jgi:hypothetical protein
MITWSKSLLVPALLALQWISTGCKCGSSTVTDGTTASASGSAPAAVFHPPRGPRFAIIAGKGIGPIRLGATPATVERLMELPCPDKSDTVYRYVDRGVEFRFTDGKLTRIIAHRGGREAPGGKVWGVFNGGIPPDLQFGMIMPAVQQFLGPPKSVKAGNEGADKETTEQHYYEGMVLEYDALPGGRVIYGAVRIPD